GADGIVRMGEGRGARACPRLRVVWRRALAPALLCRPRSEVSTRGGGVFPCFVRLPDAVHPRRRLYGSQKRHVGARGPWHPRPPRAAPRPGGAPAGGARRRRARLRARLLDLLPPVVFGAFVLALWLLAPWQLIQARGLAAAKLLLPAPDEVLRSFVQIIADP